MVQKKSFLSSSLFVRGSLPGGFGNFTMTRTKLKCKLYTFYQWTCLWLQVIENYDSAGFTNEEIPNFSHQKVQRQVTTGLVKWHDGNIQEEHPFHLSAPHPLCAKIPLVVTRWYFSTEIYCRQGKAQNKCFSWASVLRSPPANWLHFSCSRTVSPAHY